MKKNYKITIQPLTAVHIGTGKELTLLDYQILDNNQGLQKYGKFTSDRLLQRCATDKSLMMKFDTAQNSGNMKNVQDFFRQNVKVPDDFEYFCEITKGFYQLYNQNKNKDPYENASIVQEMYRPAGRNFPVIPGSSIKGAIRTAILNILLDDIDEPDYIKFAERVAKDKRGMCEQELQKYVLGNYRDAKEDPFRTVEVTDCTFDKDGSQIVGLMKNISTGTDGEIEAIEKLQIQAEMIKGVLLDKVSKSGTTQIRINTDLTQSNAPKSNRKQIPKNITIDDIIEYCNLFYWTEFENEYKKFYSKATSSVDIISDLYKELKESKNSKDTFIVRVGRWSQIEFVSFEEPFRNPQVPKRNKDDQTKYGGTRTVFDYDGQYIPMGWCKCTVKEVK